MFGKVHCRDSNSGTDSLLSAGARRQTAARDDREMEQPTLLRKPSKTDKATEYTAITTGTTAVFLKDGVAFQMPGFAFQLQSLDSSHAVEARGEDP